MPTGGAFGTGATDFFCSAVAAGSRGLIQVVRNAALMVALLVGLFVLAGMAPEGLGIASSLLWLTVIFGWRAEVTTAIMGMIIVTYTVLGGIKAITWTDVQQMVIMFCGLLTALIIAVQNRNTRLVRRLLQSGANPDKADHAAGYSARDYAKRDNRVRELLRLIETAKPAAR